MNILFVCNSDPQKASYGGLQRTHALWLGLQSVGNVVTIVPVPHRSMEKRDDNAKIYHLYLEKRYSLGWFAQRLFKRFIPYWDCSWAYNQSRFRDEVSRLVKAGRWNAVVSRFIRPAAAFKLWELGPLYVDADDIHTFEFDLHTKVIGNSLARILQRVLLARFQFRIYGKARKIWVPASEHVPLLPDYPLSCLPNIPCPPLPDVADTLGESNRLLFIGLMSSDPNYLAIDDFLMRYWTVLRRRFHDIKLDIVGGGLPQRYVESWQKCDGVIYHGRVDDIRPFFEKAGAVLTPMIIGMGSCIKTLEALRMGRFLLSTRQGLRGINANHCSSGNGIFEFHDDVSLIDQLDRIISYEPAHKHETQKRAVQFVKCFYSQSIFNQIIKDDIRDVE